MTDDWTETDPLEQARRAIKTRKMLRVDPFRVDTIPAPGEFDLSLSEVSIHDAAERATLDYLESEAATVWPIADREIERRDVRSLAGRVHRAGYNDLLVFHPNDTLGLRGPWKYESYGWPHRDMALAVAPEALAHPPTMDAPFARREFIRGVDLSPLWVVRDPRGVAVAKRVETDFEWAES